MKVVQMVHYSRMIVYVLMTDCTNLHFVCGLKLNEQLVTLHKQSFSSFDGYLHYFELCLHPPIKYQIIEFTKYFLTSKDLQSMRVDGNSLRLHRHSAVHNFCEGNQCKNSTALWKMSSFSVFIYLAIGG